MIPLVEREGYRVRDRENETKRKDNNGRAL